MFPSVPDMKKRILFTTFIVALGAAAFYAVKPIRSLKSFLTASPRAATQEPVLVSGAAGRSGTSVFLNGLGMKFIALWEANVGFAAYEVNRSQFAQFAANRGLNFPDPDPEEFLHPVSHVSWEEAAQFCQWLSEREGLTYRLPTDFEWSLAAGLNGEAPKWPPAMRMSQAPRLFHWGERWPPDQPMDNLPDQSLKQTGYAGACFSFEDGFARTAPTGSFPPNERGLYDLGGNVREWVDDFYEQPGGPKTIRGASFLSDAADEKLFLKGHRASASPGHKDETLGFRVVLELDNRSRPLFILDLNPAVSPPPQIPNMAALEGISEISGNQEIESLSSAEIPNSPLRVEQPTEAQTGESFNHYRMVYKGKDGVNIRSQSSFENSTVKAVILPQGQCDFARIGNEVEDEGVQWALLEIKGWVPVVVGKSTFLESIGNRQWKVVWNKSGDRFVAMRLESDSESTLIARINHGSVVEELESRSEGSRHYIFARLEGWAVVRNKFATYLEPVH